MTVTDVARRLNDRAFAATPRSRPPRRAGARPLPPVILMTDTERLPDPVPAVGMLAPGSAVILRHYDAPGRRELARRLLEAARARGVLVLIGADAQLAVALGADGLHLPEKMVRHGVSAEARQHCRLITAAAHSPQALFAAARAGADAALLGPVFDTASHPGARTLGALKFALWCRNAPLPVYAVGGVDETNARRLLISDAVGIAGISALVPRP